MLMNLNITPIVFAILLLLSITTVFKMTAKMAAISKHRPITL